MGWKLHMGGKEGKTGGHGKDQQEVLSKADKGSEVTKQGRLPSH